MILLCWLQVEMTINNTDLNKCIKINFMFLLNCSQRNFKLQMSLIMLLLENTDLSS